MENRYPFTLDLKNKTLSNIKYQQGDTDTSVLEINLVDGGLPKDITGQSIVFSFDKPDGTTVTQDSTNGVSVIDASSGNFQCILKNQTLAAPGLVACKIKFTDASGKILSTAKFNFTVEAGVGDGPLSINYITQIETAIAGWQADIDAMKAAYDAATKANLSLEVSNARGTFPTLTDRLNNDETQLAESLTQRINHYYVGTTQKYKTITSAYNQWITDGKPTAIIHIMQGVYKESLVIKSCSNLSFIGEDKNNTIWKTTTGYYRNAPLHIQGGNVFIKNLTLIANHDDNPSYTYTTLSGIPDVWSVDCGGAYALHCDFSGTTGLTKIENCILISYQNSAGGFGTSDSQRIETVNCDFFSYTPSTYIDEAVKNGACLYHTSATVGDTNQYLLIKNCNFFSQYGRAFEYERNIDTDGLSIVEFVNNNLASNTITDKSSLVRFTGNGANNISANSFGNNISNVNSKTLQGQLKQLTQDNGVPVTVTDWNNAYSGFLISKDGTALNQPAGGVQFFGFAITYDASTYTIQYAWQFTSAFEMYKRTKTGSGWSAWIRCINDITDLNRSLAITSVGKPLTATDMNAITITGYYIVTGTAATANIPTDGTYVAHVIYIDSVTQIQYAWNYSTGARYKRTKLAGTWGSWVAITEP